MNLIIIMLSLSDSALELSDGQRHRDALQASATHTYYIKSDGPSWLHIWIMQETTQVEARVFDPSGKAIARLDSPMHRGLETAVLPLNQQGKWQIQVTANGPPGCDGDYSIQVHFRDEPQVLAHERALTQAAMLYWDESREGPLKARDQALAAISQLKASDDRETLARAHFFAADLSMTMGRFDEAQPHVTEALALWRQLNSGYQIAWSLNYLGLIHWYLGRLDQAETALTEAVERFEQLAVGWERASTYNNLGLIDQQREQLPSAATRYQAALKALGEGGEPETRATMLMNAGVVYRDMGEPQQAEDYLSEALAVAQRPYTKAMIHNNLALTLHYAGHFQEALATYRKAHAYWQEVGNVYHEGICLNNIGYTYGELGDRSRARSYFQKALQARRKAGDKANEALTLSNLGNLDLEEENYATALEYYRQAQALFVQLKNQVGELSTQAKIGEALLHQGNVAAGMRALTKAHQHFSQGDNRYRQARLLRLMAEGHLRQNQPQQALPLFTQALEISQTTNFHAARIDSLAGSARALHQLGQTDRAIETLQSGLNVLQSLRARVGVSRLRASFLAGYQEMYDHLIHIHMERGDHAAALAVKEQARAQELRELLRQQATETPLGTKEQQEQMEQLRRKANSRAALLRIRREQGKSSADAERELDGILERLEQVEAQVHMDQKELNQVGTNAITPEDIQKMLDPRTALLQFSISENQGYAWLVTQETLQGIALEGLAEMETQVRALHEGWQHFDPYAPDTLSPKAIQLSQQLLAGLQQLKTQDRLLIVPDGVLHLLPFSALHYENGHLLDRFETTVLPSATVAQSLIRRTSLTKKYTSITLVADPVFRSNAKSSSSSVPRFQSLPGTRREAANILALPGWGAAQAKLGYEANLDVFDDPALMKVDVLHLATHAIVDQRHPDLSGMVFSLFHPDDKSREGFLRLHDIHALDLKADLVVLSGCRTAVGPRIRGEGPIRLARGFFHAGSTRVLASLWQVDDRATAQLFTHFYRALLEEQRTPAAALRLAQKAMAANRRYGNPHFWAAFTLIGDWR